MNQSFGQMRDSKAMERRGLVLTTTNKMRLDEIVESSSQLAVPAGKTKQEGFFVKFRQCAVLHISSLALPLTFSRTIAASEFMTLTSGYDAAVVEGDKI